MYAECYNENHKLIEISREKQKATKKQKGFYFDFICKTCEKRTQNYDRYASLVLTNRSPNSPESLSVKKERFLGNHRDEGLSFEQWNNLDFEKFQKFVLASILRTHCSGCIKGDIQLNKSHFKQIFSVYENKTALDDELYPIVLYRLKDSDPFKRHVVLPYFKRYAGHHLIEFMGAGYVFNLYVSSHRKPEYVNLFRLKKDGSLTLPLMDFKQMVLFQRTLDLVKTTLGFKI
ncbi:MAG: hypothetical protein GXP56_08385 [Deltaproteobacteria bacterium]|nr:hypothetical protein [Deltaproteobacteria bacterium]